MCKVKGWLLKMLSCTAAVVLFVAVSSVGTTCIFTAYQPDVPKIMQ